MPPGWVGRWVRTTDHLGRPTNARIQEFLDYGFEVVKTGAGHALVDTLGVAMVAPPEQAGLRTAECAPLGALNPDDLLSDTRIAVEEGNSAAGDEVARLVVERDHKTERITESVR